MTDEVTTSTDTENQEPEATFTQTEVDKMVSKRLDRERKKYDTKYADVDVDQYKQWRSDKEAAEIDKQKQRGEFDKVLKNTVEKKDTEIAALQAQIQKTSIDGAILTAASSLNAIAPDQVSSLIRNQLRLNGDGVAEVIDTSGNPRYSENGDLMKPSELVGEFLTANPHFVKASGGGTGSTGNAGSSTPKAKSVADMVANWHSGGKAEYAKSIGNR